VAIKLRIPKGGKAARGSGRAPSRGRGSWKSDPIIRAALVVFLVVSVVLIGTFSYFYVKYDRLIEKRFAGPVFSTSAKIYAIPRSVHVGEKISAHDVASQLQRAGYTERDGSPLGSYRLEHNGIVIKPGPESYHSPEAATIRFGEGKIEGISGKGGALEAYELEPEPVTSLFDSGDRSKRQIVTYDEIPKIMVDATVAIEDRRFFQHSGVNFVRLGEAAFIDLTRQRHEQGGSTITMQLSRAFFLSPEKTLKRKLTEILIALELEQKFSKQEIFAFYANRVDLGQRGSFTISGFAEASRAYFNKDLKDITLPEAALLAGIVQAPSALSPYRHPERALERRNVVLDSMVETGAISQEQAEIAKAKPLKLAPPNVEASDAPYFVDLVRDTIISKIPEQEVNGQQYRIYSTIDPELQRAAAQAVETGIKLVDEQVTKMRTKRVKVAPGKYENEVRPGPEAQVALVAMDPHTGQVLALVGGRNYGFSQLNHAVAKRPTGSIFKPFVYAAALNTAVDGAPTVYTPASIVQDEPTTFAYGDQIYEPRNYKEEYHGDVTLRYAIALSLNNATVKVAEAVGYDKVAELAKAAGITSVKATPAMALGAYDASPLDMAAAYTVFANGGTRLSPLLVDSVRNSKGDVVLDFQPEKRQVLDPRVAAVMTSMMEGVVNFGTAAAVRSRGFTAPAAGKTGTSHDGWFAGYTSDLLCIVWVGYDDYSDIHLSGAQTAAPIWAEFMKRAVTIPPYSNARAFTQPDGVVQVQLDKVTNRLATPACPQVYSIAFIAGTEPKDNCEQAPSSGNFLTRIFGSHSQSLPQPTVGVVGPATAVATPGQNPHPQKKKGFFGKITGIFKDDKQAAPVSKPPENENAAPH
jgi:penicillin-binding protein 1B